MASALHSACEAAAGEFPQALWALLRWVGECFSWRAPEERLRTYCSKFWPSGIASSRRSIVISWSHWNEQREGFQPIGGVPIRD